MPAISYAEIVVLRNHAKIDQGFTYLIPEILQEAIHVGSRVMVPFGAQQIEGVVIALKASYEGELAKVKQITFVFDRDLSLTEEMVQLAEHMRKQYLCTYAEAFSLMLPTGVLVVPESHYYPNDAFTGDLHAVTGSVKAIYEAVLMQRDVTIETLKVSYSQAVVKKALKQLCALYAIREEIKYIEQIKDRTVERYTVTGEMTTLFDTIPERYKMRKRVCAYFIKVPKGDLKTLREQTKAPKSVVEWFQKKHMITIESFQEKRMPEFMNSTSAKAEVALTNEQEAIVNEVLSCYHSAPEKPFLLRGVTGSGKTEVYAALIAQCLKQGKTAILTLPEIALTPQIVSRFAKRFGKERIALMHSKLSNGEKYDQWRAMRKGELDIIIGARSAIFAPISNLGIVILDESHEQSYRSERRPKYDTYEIALQRQSYWKAILLAGSATPSVESTYEGKCGLRHLMTLSNRFNNAAVPVPEIIDMREELEAGNRSMLSRALFEAIEKRLEQKEQVIIFLNRTGHSTFVTCRSCGFTLDCPNCDITLTYHKHENKMRCHYCQYESYIPKTCPSCGSHYFKQFGVGTEKLEETLKEFFPEARIGRMDRTTTSRKGQFEDIISKVEEESIDILVGTQMVAKGLDFKKVTLVGIISADLLMNMPHFQAGERTYQLVNQVSGRAGRGALRGDVILQTYQPDHYAITSDDYDAFYEMEIAYRQKLGYPPFRQLVNLVFTSRTEKTASDYAEKSYQYLYRNLLKKDLQKEMELYAVHPALLKKIDGEYRYQVLIKCDAEHIAYLRYLIDKLQTRFITISDCKINIDLNARNIL